MHQNQLQNVVFDEKGNSHLWFRADPLRSWNTLDEKLHGTVMVAENHGMFLNIYDCISEIKSFEHTQERVFANSDYKARYGAVFSFMIPETENALSMPTLRSVAKSFYNYIVGDEKNLAFFAVTYTRKNTRFIWMWIADRPFGEYTYTKKYRRNIYMNRNTHVFCKSTDPDAFLLHKKGDVMVDEEGNPRVQHARFMSRKTRIFTYSSGAVFENFCVQAKKALADIFLSFKGIFSAKKEMVIPRKSLRKVWDRFARRSVNANNRARIYVQNAFNSRRNLIMSMFPRAVQTSDLDPYGSSNVRIIPNEINDAMNALFSKFTKYFMEDEFVYRDATFSLKGGRSNTIEAVCALLISEFDREMSRIYAAALKACENTESTQQNFWDNFVPNAEATD